MCIWTRVASRTGRRMTRSTVIMIAAIASVLEACDLHWGRVPNTTGLDCSPGVCFAELGGDAGCEQAIPVCCEGGPPACPMDELGRPLRIRIVDGGVSACAEVPSVGCL